MNPILFLASLAVCHDGALASNISSQIAAFCVQEKSLNISTIQFCKGALESRDHQLTFDYRIDFDVADRKAHLLDHQLAIDQLGPGNQECRTQIYYYACAVYFPDCQHMGKTCRDYSGDCDGIELDAEKCLGNNTIILSRVEISYGVLVAIAVALMVIAKKRIGRTTPSD